MCGIAGYISFSEEVQPQADLLEHMLSTLAHRGPDGCSVHVYPQIGLAHARLKILDLSDEAQQPFTDISRKYALVYNGEIYNHLDIRKKLKFQDFKTHSDTETLFYALQELGTSIIPQLNGIFSFAFIDLQDLKAIVARDRYGIKPLYFYHDKACFYFASELKALLQIPTLPKDLDWDALNEHIALLGAQGRKTPYSAIQKVLPGECLSIDANNASVSFTEFWSIPIQRSYIKDSTEKIIQNTEALLIAAVRRQLLSDAPVGFFLSGGLDSSLLVAIAQKHGAKHRSLCYTLKQDTASRGFDNDYPYARKLAQSMSWDLQLVEKPQLDLLALDRIIDTLQAPLLDLSALNVEAIAHIAQRQGTKVLISGLGADDIFTGYRRHVAAQVHCYIKKLPLHLTSSIQNIFSEHSNAKRWLQKFLEAWHKDPDTFLARMHLYTSEYYLHQPVKGKPEESLVSFLKKFDRGVSVIDKALALELHSYLPAQNLLYTDMASMKHGVEVRVPYLDNELSDYLYHVPSQLKMRGFETKYILREIARGYLPRSILKRKKVGFSEVLPAPLAKTIQEKIKGHFQHLEITDFASNPQLLLNLYAVYRFMAKTTEG